LRDYRARLDLDHADVEAEVLERLFQNFRLAAELLFVLLIADFVVGQEQVQRRQLVGDLRVRLLVGRFELFDDFLPLAFLLRLLAAIRDAQRRLQAVRKFGTGRDRFSGPGIRRFRPGR
jgi:hypothetical protein